MLLLKGAGLVCPLKSSTLPRAHCLSVMKTITDVFFNFLRPKLLSDGLFYFSLLFKYNLISVITKLGLVQEFMFF